jgi:hypothetical protein
MTDCTCSTSIVLSRRKCGNSTLTRMITEANRILDGETLVEGCLVFSPTWPNSVGRARGKEGCSYDPGRTGLYR